MLDSFRNASKSWFVKLLFALLALSFLAWGIEGLRGNMFGSAPAVEVGDNQVSAQEVYVEFKREVDRMNPMFGGKLTADDARKLGFMDRTIENVVTRLLIQEAGNRLGLAASEDSVVARIAADPAYRTEGGQFDRERFRMALARAGLNERSFLAQERANVMRTQLAEGLSGGVKAPDAMVAPLTRHREERRVADTVLVRDDSVPLPPAPEQSKLEAYYQANTPRFMAPEFRALTVLVVKPETVAAQVEISAQDVDDAYQNRIDEFQSADRVMASQMVLPDQAAADKAAALVKAGKSLTAIAAELNVKVVDLGLVERGDLPDDLAEALFSAQPGSVTLPVKSPLGWHVAQTRVRPVEDIKKQVEAELRAERANERLSDLSTQIEDSLGAGTSLEETAARFGLRVVKVPATDAHGIAPSGKPVADLPQGETFLDVAFHTEQGTESQLTQADNDGYFIVRVDGVTPPQPRPLADIKGEVVAAWQAERRHELAQERAAKAAEALKAGKTAAEVAQSLGAKAQTTQPFSRDGAEEAQLPPQLVTELFQASVGGVATGAAPGGWMAGRLAKVVPFDAAAQPKVAENTARQVTSALASDLIEQYLAALNASVGVRVDRSQLSREE
ncbi:peptidylprolyl isomerase [Magnetospirillum aberrantis]|uniref:Parvulin-like PPIase n=1 Tax=Magnetospirillum aberrantis SpK TaxID=908842 RepID=A0A7C9UWR0_9PROT|nr:peptidylprolyl isomerase [Magnetospirillum aberrantis]NFV82328.1 parvulin peptidyl-prolyl isomerase [Magnetospirillum aberrantis SpK]